MVQQFAKKKYWERTALNFKVCAWRKFPVKHWSIYHINIISWSFYLSSNCSVFKFQKNITYFEGIHVNHLRHFIQHKPISSEEWSVCSRVCKKRFIKKARTYGTYFYNIYISTNCAFIEVFQIYKNIL